MQPKDEQRSAAFRLYADSGGELTNTDIAQQVGVDQSQVSRWKKKDAWESRVVRYGLIPREQVDEMLAVALQDIDWTTGQALTGSQLEACMAILLKNLMRDALLSTSSGWLQFKNMYQLREFMEMLLREMHLATGTPTEIKQTNQVLAILPEDDKAAMKTSLRFLLHSRARRKRIEARQAREADEIIDVTPLQGGE